MHAANREGWRAGPWQMLGEVGKNSKGKGRKGGRPRTSMMWSSVRIKSSMIKLPCSPNKLYACEEQPRAARRR
jgi:hypothetical protein